MVQQSTTKSSRFFRRSEKQSFMTGKENFFENNPEAAPPVSSSRFNNTSREIRKTKKKPLAPSNSSTVNHTEDSLGPPHAVHMMVATKPSTVPLESSTLSSVKLQDPSSGTHRDSARRNASLLKQTLNIKRRQSWSERFSWKRSARGSEKAWNNGERCDVRSPNYANGPNDDTFQSEKLPTGRHKRSGSGVSLVTQTCAETYPGVPSVRGPPAIRSAVKEALENGHPVPIYEAVNLYRRAEVMEHNSTIGLEVSQYLRFQGASGTDAATVALPYFQNELTMMARPRFLYEQ